MFVCVFVRVVFLSSVSLLININTTTIHGGGDDVDVRGRSATHLGGLQFHLQPKFARRYTPFIKNKMAKERIFVIELLKLLNFLCISVDLSIYTKLSFFFFSSFHEKTLLKNWKKRESHFYFSFFLSSVVVVQRRRLSSVGCWFRFASRWGGRKERKLLPVLPTLPSPPQVRGETAGIWQQPARAIEAKMTTMTFSL